MTNNVVVREGSVAEGKSRLTVSILISLVILVGSLVVNYFAGTYATLRASNSVTDIVLSNIRVFNVDWFFTYGAILFWFFVIYLSVTKPARVPYMAKSISLFVLIRAFFISLTHIGPFPTHVVVAPSYILSKFTFGADLFFSGHTGLPFLMALLFWEQKPLRIFFIVASVVFGAVVLLGHLHYTIDVCAAFFITYTINHLAEVFFPKEWRLFHSQPTAVAADTA